MATLCNTGSHAFNIDLDGIRSNKNDSYEKTFCFRTCRHSEVGAPRKRGLYCEALAGLDQSFRAPEDSLASFDVGVGS